MPPFSFVLLAILGFLGYKNRKDHKLMLRDFFIVTLLVSFTMNYGYFLKIGSFELAYDEFCTGVLFIVCIPYFIKGKYNHSMLSVCCVFLVSCIISLFCTTIVPFVPNGFLTPSQSWDEFVYGNISLNFTVTASIKMLLIPLRFVIFFFILCVIKDVFTKEDWLHAFQKLLYVCKFLLLFSVIEFFTKNVLAFDYCTNLLDPIFGKGDFTANTILVNRGDALAPQGLFREPSHFTSFLFWLGFAWFIPIKQDPTRESNYFWLATTATLLIFSTSFAGILFFGCLLAFYLVYFYKTHKSSKAPFFIVLVSSLALLMGLILFSPGLASYYLGRIKDTFHCISLLFTSNEVVLSSEFIRLLSIFKLSLIWIDRFFFGIGYGVTWGHSALIWMLACGGIVGLYIWYVFIFKRFIPNHKKSLAELFLLIAAAFTQNLSLFYSFPVATILFLLHKGARQSTLPLSKTTTLYNPT